MKEILADIKKHSFRPCYLLCGEEAYLIRQYRDRLADAIVPPEDEMNRAYFAGNRIDPKEIISLSDTMPFFSEKRLILIENSGFFKASSPEMAEYIPSVPEETCLIFTETEVDKRNALYKAVQKNGYVASFERQDEKTLTIWAAKLLSEGGRRIRESDVQYFLSLVGDDMFRIRGELTKLIDYTEGKGTVTRADIDAVVSPEIENRIFDMIRAVTEGRKDRALSLYGDLIALREPPLRILMLLNRQYDQLMRTKYLSAEKVEAGEIAKMIGAPQFAVRNYLRHVKKIPAEELRGCVEACIKTEEDIKSGRIEDRLAVELLLLTFSGVR